MMFGIKFTEKSCLDEFRALPIEGAAMRFPPTSKPVELTNHNAAVTHCIGVLCPNSIPQSAPSSTLLVNRFAVSRQDIFVLNNFAFIINDTCDLNVPASTGGKTFVQRVNVHSSPDKNTYC